MLLHHFCVVALVRGGAGNKRHQDAGDACGSQFGQRDGTGPAQHQIGFGIALGHVVDEGQHFGLHPGFGIGGTQGLDMLLAGLVRDDRALLRRQPQQGLRHGLVQHLRPLAAAHHQQTQRATASGKTLRRFVQCQNLGAHRVAGDYGLVAQARFGLIIERKTEQDLARMR